MQFYAKWIPPQQFLAMPTGDSWSPSGKFFIAGNFEKEANIWDTQSGKLIAKLLRSFGGYYASIAAITSGDRLNFFD